MKRVRRRERVLKRLCVSVCWGEDGDDIGSMIMKGRWGRGEVVVT